MTAAQPDHARQRAEGEATSIMEEFDASSPLTLAQELALKREVYDGGSDFALDIAEVLRSRQAEWLKGRRWSAAAPIPGRRELRRTSEYAQAAADADDVQSWEV